MKNNMEAKTIPHYRLWVYCFNAIMLALQATFVCTAWIMLRHEWISLFPFTATDLSVVYIYVTFSLQFCACLCGIWAVYHSNLIMLRLYFILLIPLMIGDVSFGVVWAIRFRQLHLHYSDFIATLWSEKIHLNVEQATTNFCHMWDDVQQTLNCCGPLGFEQLPHLLLNYCGQQLNGSMIPPSCCPQPASDGCTAESAFQLACDKPLLKWMHSQIDLLAIIGYWCLFPLKLIFVLVLRKELTEIFIEIYKTGNQDLFRHWAEAPEQADESNNRDVSVSDYGSNNRDASVSDYGADADAQVEQNGNVRKDTQPLLLLAQAQAVRFRIDPASSMTNLT